MRILLLSLMMAPAAWALQAGVDGCTNSPNEPFVLLNSESYSYSESCAIPAVVNDWIVNRHRQQLKQCWEHSLREGSLSQVELPLSVSIDEDGVSVLAPVGVDLPMDAQISELQDCLSERLAKLHPPPQLGKIGGPKPWMLRGILRFEAKTR